MIDVINNPVTYIAKNSDNKMYSDLDKLIGDKRAENDICFESDIKYGNLVKNNSNNEVYGNNIGYFEHKDITGDSISLINTCGPYSKFNKTRLSKRNCGKQLDIYSLLIDNKRLAALNGENINEERDRLMFRNDKGFNNASLYDFLSKYPIAGKKAYILICSEFTQFIEEYNLDLFISIRDIRFDGCGNADIKNNHDDIVGYIKSEYINNSDIYSKEFSSCSIKNTDVNNIYFGRFEDDNHVVINGFINKIGN